MQRTPLAARLVLVAVAACAASSSALAAPAVCSPASGGGATPNGPPSGKVRVTIESMKLNEDMDPDYVLWTDHSDVFGKVTINADGTPETFSLPEINNNDAPTWNGDSGTFVSRPAILGQKVHITIHMEEDDWGVTGYNDPIDVSPAAHDDLELDLDTCALTVTGDIVGPASGAFHVKAGNGSNQGTLTFRIDMDDGRALSDKQDVVLQGFDLVQVLPNVDRLVSGKPTKALVTVANNTKLKQPVFVHVHVTDETGTVLFDQPHYSMGADMQPGEVRSVYVEPPFVTNDFSCKTARVSGSANLELTVGQQDPGNAKVDCWVQNDSSGTRNWTSITTYTPSLLWLRTGDLLVANSLPTVQQQQVQHDLTIPFIRALYPTKQVDDSVTTFGYVPPLSGGIFSLITSILDAIGVPLDVAKPYTMIYELSFDAALIGVDKIMGVVPKGWFGANEYGFNSSLSGLSLGTIAPHAVLFVDEADDGTGSGHAGPMLTNPAHEMGHTYGLSLDPNIKNWACYLPGALGVIGCAVKSGYDEYKDSQFPTGIPTWGLWIPQSVGTIFGITGEQCGTTCLMGPTVVDAEQVWNGGGSRWVDAADYDHLLDAFNANKCVWPRSSTLYVSGAIGGDNSIALGWMASLPGQTHAVDFPNTRGKVQAAYGVRMVDAKGTTLSESELPLGWPFSDTDAPIDVTLFGGYVDYPVGTSKIQIWSRVDNKLLAERAVSRSAPVVGRPSFTTHLSGKERFLDIAWTATDADRDPLTHFVMMSSDRGAHWAPVAHALTSAKFSLSLTGVASGSYLVKVVTSDGVNLGSATGGVSL